MRRLKSASQSGLKGTHQIVPKAYLLGFGHLPLARETLCASSIAKPKLTKQGAHASDLGSSLCSNSAARQKARALESSRKPGVSGSVICSSLVFCVRCSGSAFAARVVAPALGDAGGFAATL